VPYIDAEIELPVSKGARGEHVKEIQQLLNNWIHKAGRPEGFYQDFDLTVDGGYGNNTAYVMARFQTYHDLSATGQLDQKSYDLLRGYAD
jgi:peptidoglycan hydrolase-like protein with peptidoglycan-binding domain